MDLCNIKEIRELLGRHGFSFSKSLGQNFLVSSWVPERIAELSGITENDCVLEIGPGIGCLTRELSFRAGKVVAVELDARLMPILGETLSDRPNVTVINGDIMKTDLGTLASEHFGGLSPVVCANLPYNITTPVLSRLIDSRIFNNLTVMIQKEVAERVCALPGTSEYGAFTVYANFYTKPEILFDVPPNCFEPRPKVTSSVISLKTRERPAAECDEELFFRIVRAAFNQRRKTLSNAVHSGFSSVLSKNAITDAVEACGFDPKVRGEALDIEAFARLTMRIGELLNDN